jgi:hypothetical protein
VDEGRAEPQLLIETYAAIKRAVWSKPGALDGILEERGLTMIAWLEEERLWAEAMSREAAEGRCDLALLLHDRLQPASG